MIDSSVVMNFKYAYSAISGMVQFYNYERRHSSLQYLTIPHYYRMNPDKSLKIREIKRDGKNDKEGKKYERKKKRGSEWGIS